MNRRKRSWLPWLAMFWLSWISMPLWAADCSISASGINFGNYDPVAGTMGTGNGTVTVNCTQTSFGDFLFGFTVTTSLSTGSSGTYLNRTLKKGAENLYYNLYTNPSYSIIFGNGSGATSSVQICYPGLFLSCGGSPSGNDGTPFPVTVYGRIPASQNVGVGVYSDTIIATITF